MQNSNSFYETFKIIKLESISFHFSDDVVETAYYKKVNKCKTSCLWVPHICSDALLRRGVIRLFYASFYMPHTQKQEKMRGQRATLRALVVLDGNGSLSLRRPHRDPTSICFQ